MTSRTQLFLWKVEDQAGKLLAASFLQRCRLLEADADMDAQLNPPSPEHFLADLNSAVLS